MSQDDNERKNVIPVEMIKDAVMPPYHYQVLQSCFGMAGSTPEKDTKEEFDKSLKD
ncbi:MAG: hypothetical protein OXH47_08945 [Paracoccaceae bacterium]|nr:hypothetical protein [Paracoccaceae bacterium]